VSTVDTPFAAAYELELNVDLPAAGGGPVQFFYPGAREAGSSDLLARVTPFDRDPWLANFAAGGFPLTAVTTCPDPNLFCAVVRGAGYMVRADDAHVWSKVRAHPVQQVIPDLDHELVVVRGFHQDRGLWHWRLRMVGRLCSRRVKSLVTGGDGALDQRR